MLGRLMLAALLVVACGSQSTQSDPPAQPPVTPQPQASPSTIATAAPAVELPVPVVELEPGTYTKSTFTPRVTFTVGDGWTAAQSTAGFFDIQDEPGSLDVVAVQFGNVAEAETAAEAAEKVAARSNLTVREPESVKVDGVPGLRLIIETTDPPDTNPEVFRPVIRLTPGEVSIASARRLDLTLLDVDGEVLAIMVGGSIAEWQRAVELSAPVIASVQIGED